jgi:hypothetical protein
VNPILVKNLTRWFVMSKKTYLEKLKEPRWQKKRLEVFDRSNWECECCGDKEKTLHVHHKAYKKNAEPWEYEEHELACLCEDCHEYETYLDKVLSDLLYKYKTDPYCMGLTKEYLIGVLQGICFDGTPLSVDFLSTEQVRGIAHYCGWILPKEHEDQGIEIEDYIITRYLTDADANYVKEIPINDISGLEIHRNDSEKSD